MKFTFLLPLFLLLAHSDIPNSQDNYIAYITNKNNSGEESPLCGSSILLYDDSTYYYEGGCESVSYICSGKWTKRGDTLLLHATPAQDITPIKDVVLKSNPKHKEEIHLRILSRNGDTLNINYAPYLYKKDTPPPTLYFWKDWSSSNFGPYKEYTFKSDSSAGIIEIRKLSAILGRTILVPIGNHNDITVVLNLPTTCLQNLRGAKYECSPTSQLISRGDSLISFPLDPKGYNYHKTDTLTWQERKPGQKK